MSAFKKYIDTILRQFTLFRILLVITFSLLFIIYFTLTYIPKKTLDDPNVTTTWVDCGSNNQTAGLGMPAWPTPDSEQFYTRSYWEGQNYVAEIWSFKEPGHVLIAIDKQVKNDRILVNLTWGNPSGVLAACYAKLGVKFRIENIPVKNYTLSVSESFKN